MNISRFFIDRPVFAGVLSVLIFVFGLIALTALPVSEYPEVVPPQIMCLPCFEKNSDIILLQSPGLDGGPIIRFIGSLRRMRTVHTVVSSPGSPP